jgi:hypothetical protein
MGIGWLSSFLLFRIEYVRYLVSTKYVRYLFKTKYARYLVRPKL